MKAKGEASSSQHCLKNNGGMSFGPTFALALIRRITRFIRVGVNTIVLSVRTILVFLEQGGK